MSESLIKTKQIEDHLFDLVRIGNLANAELGRFSKISTSTITDEQREQVIYSSFFGRLYKVHQIIKSIFDSPEAVETKEFSIAILMRPLLLDAMIVAYLENLDSTDYLQALNGLAIDAPEYWLKFLERYFSESTESWVENEKAHIYSLRERFPGNFPRSNFSAINLFTRTQSLPTDFKKLMRQCYLLYERYSKYDHFSIIGGINNENELTKLKNIQFGLCCTTTSLDLICSRLGLASISDELKVHLQLLQSHA